MKITDLEDGADVATKLDLRELRADLIEHLQKIDSRLNGFESRLNGIDSRLNHLQGLVWLPVLSSSVQIIVTLLHK